ncbi:MAG: hypothetical protein AAF705_10235 [Bacteroidota bacterium]
MDILKAAIDWGKAEVFSTTFFILFGGLFLLASFGFWQLGKTEIAKAFTTPTLVVGLLLITIGLGLFFTNRARVANFSEAYENDPTAFVASEVIRAEKAMAEYQLVVFKIIPAIIILAALLIIFIDRPNWRAISITTIAMMVIILSIDINANARISEYHQQLISLDKSKE